MQATMTKKETLENEAKEIAATEVLVETNDGTYGGTEAVRVCGSGDPAFATYKTYERVGDGSRRTTGCDPNNAPGRARQLNATQMSQLRAKLRDLREQIKRA